MSSIATRTLLIAGILVIMFVLYPTVFDARPTVYDHARWVADSLGLVIGYIAVVFGLSLLPISGGHMRRGLFWFFVGTLVMGCSFLFGPLVNHYRLLDSEVVKGLHGIGMLGGMLGYLIAVYLFLTIVGSKTLSGKYLWFCALIFVLFTALFYPTMAATRALGSVVNYWADLVSFGIGGVMLSMIIREYRHIGPGYRKAMTMLCISTVFMTLSYPVGIISQPNSFWTATQGGVFHHGFMVISISCFLVTVFYLKRLEIYSSPSSNVRTYAEVTDTNR